jgi:hypothetical protein
MVFSSRGNVVDSIVPPVVFLSVNALGRFDIALGAALLSAAAFSALRLLRRQPLRWAIGGLMGVVVAVLIARLLGRAEGFFVPSLITGSVTVTLCLVSILIRRPMVAWTSALARGWPWQWYWHRRVRPAYTEVTWLWALYFGLRLFFQLELFRSQSAELLGRRLAGDHRAADHQLPVRHLATEALAGPERRGVQGRKGAALDQPKAGVLVLSLGEAELLELPRDVLARAAQLHVPVDVEGPTTACSVARSVGAPARRPRQKGVGAGRVLGVARLALAQTPLEERDA